MNPNAPSNTKVNPRLFLVLFIFSLLLSAIHPNDYLFWVIRIFPILIGVLILILTYNRIHFSDFTYFTILIYSGVILEGAHFGNSNVPLFVIIKELLHENYNYFDKFSSFAQGFAVAAVFREILVRLRIIHSGMWQYLMVVCFGISFHVIVTQIDWIVLELVDNDFDLLISSQQSIRDVLLNIFSAMLGSMLMLIFLGKVQYKRIRGKSAKP